MTAAAPPQDVIKPRRSVLYMPSSNARALEKAKSIPADALILDLEDAVAPDAKSDARTAAVASATLAAETDAYGHREITIRANDLSTPWGADDLAAIATSGAAAVVIPKVNSTEQLDRVSQQLSAAGAPDELSIWAMIETPIAIIDAAAIAEHARVEVLVLGTNDLVKELRAAAGNGREAIVPHLASAVLAARAAGIDIVDGVFNDISDADGFTAEAEQGLRLGFDGKTLIHPSQVGVANDVWSPSESDVAHARRVVDAFAEAEAQGLGVVTVDGAMVENLHRDNSLRTLAVAKAIAGLAS